MKRYRILTDIFNRYFVEQKKWYGWRRFPHDFNSIESAELFIRKERVSQIGMPWVVKEVQIVTNYI